MELYPTAGNAEQVGPIGETALPAAKEPEDRFKLLVTILIAIVSIAGAVLAWRVSTAASAAGDADVDGIVSTVNRNQALVASESDMYRNMGAYLQVRLHNLASRSLAAEWKLLPQGAPREDFLWSESWTEIYVAEQYLGQVDIRPEYVRPDGSYDGQAAQDVDMAGRAMEADLDPLGRHFATADRMRLKVEWLMGTALILTTVLFLYTLATVVKGRLKYLFLALGSTVFGLVLVAVVVIETTLR